MSGHITQHALSGFCYILLSTVHRFTSTVFGVKKKNTESPQHPEGVYRICVRAVLSDMVYWWTWWLAFVILWVLSNLKWFCSMKNIRFLMYNGNYRNNVSWFLYKWYFLTGVLFTHYINLFCICVPLDTRFFLKFKIQECPFLLLH